MPIPRFTILARAFTTPRHTVSYIMDTFPIVKRKDEAKHGTYRTKETILKIYDAIAHSIATGHPPKPTSIRPSAPPPLRPSAPPPLRRSRMLPSATSMNPTIRNPSPRNRRLVVQATPFRVNPDYRTQRHALEAWDREASPNTSTN